MSEDQEHIHEIEEEIKRDTIYIRIGIAVSIVVTALCFMMFVLSDKGDKKDEQKRAQKFGVSAKITDYKVYLDRPEKLIIDVSYAVTSSNPEHDTFRLIALPDQEACKVKQGLTSFNDSEGSLKIRLNYAPVEAGETQCTSLNMNFIVNYFKDDVFAGKIASKTVSLKKTWAQK